MTPTLAAALNELGVIPSAKPPQNRNPRKALSGSSLANLTFERKTHATS